MAARKNELRKSRARRSARASILRSAPLLIAIVVSVIYTFIGGARRKLRRFAALAALVTAAIPVLFSRALTAASARLSLGEPDWLVGLGALLAAVFIGAWVFGVYLALLTRFGLEHTQAFTALDHPGFKHFVRLRVHASGRRIDGWCLGPRDPLDPSELKRSEQYRGAEGDAAWGWVPRNSLRAGRRCGAPR